MDDKKPKVATDPEEIRRKILDFEKRVTERASAPVDDWPTVETDMALCIAIMLVAFGQAGGPVPAYVFRADEGHVGPSDWVIQVQEQCRRTHGAEKGAVIAAKVMERLSQLAASMGGQEE